MGKAQTKKKLQRWRHNPIRVPDSHLGGGNGEGKADQGKEKQMLPILSKLKSPNYADRTWACAAICTLIQNDPATRRLFQGKGVVSELVERLSDDVDEVVVEASGALRNLAIDGGHELCSEMFNRGIMSHLIVIMRKISDTIDNIISSTPSDPLPLSDSQVQDRKHLLSLSENVITLIWCLAEATHKTLDAVNGASVEGLLVKVIEARRVCGTGVLLAAAEALYALTQDNWPFTKSLLHHPGALTTLASACREDLPAEEAKSKGKKKQLNGDAGDDGRASLARLLLCGTLRNVVRPDGAADRDIDIRGLTNEVILPLIQPMLGINLHEVVAEVQQLVLLIPEQSVVKSQDKNVKTDHRSPSELRLEHLERTLNTLAVALEILTGICAGVEDDETDGQGAVNGDGEAGEDDEDEGMIDDIPSEDLIALARDSGVLDPHDDDDIAMNGESDPRVNSSSLPYLLTILLLPSRLAALSALTPLSFPPANIQPSIHPPTTAAISTVHLRALEALNNLLITVAASLPSQTEARSQASASIPLAALWEATLAILQTLASEPEVMVQKGQEMRGEVMEMAIGCLWGVGKAGISHITIYPAHLQLLISAFALVRNDDAKSRLIELLAIIASRPAVTPDQNQGISQFILSLLDSPSTKGEVLVAVINAIIDIYADETRAYDVVFTQNKYLERLSAVVGRVRSLVKSIDKKKDRALRVRGDEAYENLASFVKYRRALRQ